MDGKQAEGIRRQIQADIYWCQQGKKRSENNTIEGIKRCGEWREQKKQLVYVSKIDTKRFKHEYLQCVRTSEWVFG